VATDCHTLTCYSISGLCHSISTVESRSSRTSVFWFHTFVITHFNIIAFTFRGWFQRIRKKWTTRVASLFAHALLILRRTLSAVSSSVCHKVELIHKRSTVPSCKWRAALYYCAALRDCVLNLLHLQIIVFKFLVLMTWDCPLVSFDVIFCLQNVCVFYKHEPSCLLCFLRSRRVCVTDSFTS
jgi:hypothetical protein